MKSSGRDLVRKWPSSKSEGDKKGEKNQNDCLVILSTLGVRAFDRLNFVVSRNVLAATATVRDFSFEMGARA